jgi:hypothetical protein
MGGACGMYGGKDSFMKEFGMGNLRERKKNLDLGVDGLIVLSWIFAILGWEGLEWIGLAQYSYSWWVFVKRGK